MMPAGQSTPPPPGTASVPGAPAARFFDGPSSGPVRRVTIAA